MTERVPAEDIERIVGAPRHPFKHIARAVSSEQTVYIMHPASCLASHDDLRDCYQSIALDRGIDLMQWAYAQDGPWYVGAVNGRLVPLGPVSVAVRDA